LKNSGPHFDFDFDSHFDYLTLLSMNAGYTIVLPQFEGPFDLLLFFIERDELDIHDIPIAKITNDFLAYIQDMESLNIDLASEFILVAATLMRIKAKMLIPRKPIDEEGNEIDPREELVARLLEYKRYKSVLEEMRQLEEDRSFRNPRGNTTRELRSIAERALVDVELESLTLFKLMKAFERVITRMEDRNRKTIHHVYTYRHTVPGQQVFLLSKIKRGEKTDFQTIFGKCEDRIHAIVTFLALLELVNLQKLKCIPGEGVNNFWLTMPEDEEVPDVVHEDEEE
jgi:segregation and condensation protein A